MLKRVTVLASMGLAVLMMGTGCSHKTAQQRDSLADQNKSLADQLAAEKQRADAAEARANAATNNAVTPAPTDAATPATPATPGMDDMTPSMPAPEKGSEMGRGVELHKNKYGQSVIQISGDVLFASGKASLKPTAMKALDRIAALIKQKYRGEMLRIEGHTDPNPVRSSGWDDNWDLGHARARAVLLYLIKKGVPKKDMYSASFADNDLKSSKNFALDRRVDIVVTNSGR